MKQLPEKHHFKVIQLPLNFAEARPLATQAFPAGGCYVGRPGA